MICQDCHAGGSLHLRMHHMACNLLNCQSSEALWQGLFVMRRCGNYCMNLQGGAADVENERRDCMSPPRCCLKPRRNSRRGNNDHAMGRLLCSGEACRRCGHHRATRPCAASLAAVLRLQPHGRGPRQLQSSAPDVLHLSEDLKSSEAARGSEVCSPLNL